MYNTFSAESNKSAPKTPSLRDAHSRDIAFTVKRLFGFDSGRIHDALGYPVVNMGLNAGLGLKYMLAEAQSFVGEGDIVVISPEYEQFYGNTFYGSRVLLETIRLYPPAIQHALSVRQALELMRAFPPYVQDRIRQVYIDYRRSPEQEDPPHPVYRRDAFNRYGDVVSHVGRDAPTRPVEEMNFLVALHEGRGTFRRNAIRELDRFHGFAAERDARAFVLPPTVPEYHFARDSAAIFRVYRRLRAESEIEVLGDPEDQVAPEDRFYDTAYHMSGKGREERTDRLIALLRRALAPS